jgi:hypothetical protein
MVGSYGVGVHSTLSGMDTLSHPVWGAPFFLHVPSPVGWAEELRTFGATAGGKMWVIAGTMSGASKHCNKGNICFL